MIVDTSAVIAVANGEPETPSVLDLLAATDGCSMSTATWLETMIVAERGGSAERVGLIEQLLETWAVNVLPVDLRQAEAAREAYRLYGKGRNSRAALNYGDCFSYALSRVRREPLLFVGNDFIHTDVEVALRP